MADTDFIAKTPQLEKSQDYAFLRTRGLEAIERLAHELWTDYNVHDPGVTILEHLCYAITELGYRTGYDVEDLLTEIEDGVPVNHGDFHTAREVLTNHPVSFDDLRKLLIDVAGVRNAWIEEHLGVWYYLDREAERLSDQPTAETITVAGLYDVFIEYDDDVEVEPRVLRVGLPDNSGGGGFKSVQGKGIRFDVDYPLTLAAVSVYPQAVGEVTIRLEDAGGHRIAEKAAVALAGGGGKQRIPLGFRVEPGEGYRLRAFGAVKLHRSLSPSPDYPFAIDRLIRLVGGVGGGGAGYFFFYDWEVSFAVAPDAATAETPATSTLTGEDVRLAVLDRLHRRRNLCQDFVNVCALEKEKVAVCTDVELEPGADVEEVLAEIFYRLELHVSPPVRFYTIAELLARGKTVEEIFAGPTLDHGFIDDEEFRKLQRRCEIRASDVVRVLMDVAGVVAVRSVSLLRFAPSDPSDPDPCLELLDQQPWILPLGSDRRQAPDFSPQCSKVVFYKNDLPYVAHRDTVAELLAEKRSADLTPKLKGHEADLEVPAGEARDLETWEPIQNELPGVYAVGRVAVPASRPARRRAQALQLRAYLMVFEQLLANHLAQLAHVRELFSWRPPQSSPPQERTATYFTQPVTGIAELEKVYRQDLVTADRSGDPMIDEEVLSDRLEELIEDREAAGRRRRRFLEHLVARYAEDLTGYGRLMEGLLKDAAHGRLIGDKEAFLDDYPAVGGERGQAHDYRRSEGGLSGFARRVYRLLGFRDVRARQLAGHRFEISEDGSPPGWRFVLAGDSEEPLFESVAYGSKQAAEALLDFALDLGADESNWRNQDGVWELVLECPGEDDPRRIGSTTSAAVPKMVVLAAFRETAEAEGFHLVEHVLLRQRTLDEKPDELPEFMSVQLDDGTCDCVEVTDPYSFRATVVLLSWPRRFQDVKFRRFVEDTLRREAPAHVYLKICWISHQQMKEFEVCFREWTRELAELARGLGRCRDEAQTGAEPPLSGELPLPPTGPQHREYREALGKLIAKLHRLVTIHPLARLHDCREASGDSPLITLDNTSLGTF